MFPKTQLCHIAEPVQSLKSISRGVQQHFYTFWPAEASLKFKENHMSENLVLVNFLNVNKSLFLWGWQWQKPKPFSRPRPTQIIPTSWLLPRENFTKPGNQTMKLDTSHLNLHLRRQVPGQPGKVVPGGGSIIFRDLRWEALAPFFGKSNLTRGRSPSPPKLFRGTSRQPHPDDETKSRVYLIKPAENED